jgi:hypothetical protein
MTKGRELLFTFLVPIGTFLIALAVLELLCRFLPVSSGLHAVSVSAENPIFHFTPNRPFLHSLGWDMHNINRGHTNNAGFIHDSDYRSDDPQPLLAVIGDSYIEARMVPFAETMQGRLARVLNGKFRVYSFAAGGAPLSQYLIWAQHAVREYGARALVINVVGNDFDESLLTYKLGPGFWLYFPDERGELRLRLVEHRPGWGFEIVRRSALARYFFVNLQLYSIVFNTRALGELIFGKPAHAQPRYAGNTDVAADATRVRDSLAAIDAFFRDLPEMAGLSPTAILFTVDGFRYPGTAQLGRGTYFDLMRRSFLEKANSLGYEAIDLDERFFARHLETSEHFESSDDNHWNGTGHGVAAEAVTSSQFWTRLRVATEQ